MTSPRDVLPIASNNLVAKRLPLILASESPRRLALLAQIGIIPQDVRAASLDETPLKNELPRPYAARLARAKAETVRAVWTAGPAMFLAADTVVACGRRILPKPEDEAGVIACLNLLSGRSHQVMTSIALALPQDDLRQRTILTRVRFRRLTSAEIETYAASREGLGKAGGYAIQGRADGFVESLNGSYSNVVGLPLSHTLNLLRGCGQSVL